MLLGRERPQRASSARPSVGRASVRAAHVRPSVGPRETYRCPFAHSRFARWHPTLEVPHVAACHVRDEGENFRSKPPYF